MNVNPYNTTEYENKSNRTLGENKPNQSQFQKPIIAPKEWQEDKGVMVAYRRHEYDGPERVGTRSLDGYTRSTAAFISCIARDPILLVSDAKKMCWGAVNSHK